MVRYQGRYANRLAELTGAFKNGDQCGTLENFVNDRFFDNKW